MAWALAAALPLTACSAIPQDPDGTLQEVTDGTLVVGATQSGPWVELGEDGTPVGVEPTLVEAFAENVGAEVEWVVGAEHELVEGLRRGELHLVIGGIEASTPWSAHVALTQPYSAVVSGTTSTHVLLAPRGENAFLLELDRFILARNDE